MQPDLQMMSKLLGYISANATLCGMLLRESGENALQQEMLIVLKQVR